MAGWKTLEQAQAPFRIYHKKSKKNLFFLPLFAAPVWSILFQCNKSHLQENSLPLKNIAGFAQDYIREFKILVCTPLNSLQVVPRKWHSLVVGLMKTNYDVAMFREFDEARIGVVI